MKYTLWGSRVGTVWYDSLVRYSMSQWGHHRRDSYGSWIYNYLCNQCLSPLKLWIRIPLRQWVLDTALCDKACQWLAAGWWFFAGTPLSSTNQTYRHNITEIFLKVS